MRFLKKVLAWIYLFSYINERTAWGRSSAGRALDWQSRGQGFDPPLSPPKNAQEPEVRFRLFFIAIDLCSTLYFFAVDLI